MVEYCSDRPGPMDHSLLRQIRCQCDQIASKSFYYKQIGPQSAETAPRGDTRLGMSKSRTGCARGSNHDQSWSRSIYQRVWSIVIEAQFLSRYLIRSLNCVIVLMIERRTEMSRLAVSGMVGLLVLIGILSEVQADFKAELAAVSEPERVPLFIEHCRLETDATGPEKLDCIEEVLEIAVELADRHLEAAILFQSGKLMSGTGAADRAIDFLERAAALYSELDLAGEEEKVYYELAFLHYHRGEYDRSLSYFEKVLAMNKRLQNKSGLVKAYNNIGIIHRNLSNYDQALVSFEQALELEREGGEPKNVALILNNIATIYQKRGEYDQASKTIYEALSLCQELDDAACASYAYSSLGHMYDHTAQFEQALTFYRKALELEQQSHNPFGIARSSGNIGSVYLSLGRYEQALELQLQALAYFEQGADQGDIARALDNVGICYQGLNDYSRALEYHQRALELREKMGDAESLANSCNNISLVYKIQGRLDLAIEYAIRSLELREQIGDRLGQTASLNNIGSFYNDLNRPELARDYFNRSWSLAEEIGAMESVVRTLLHLSNTDALMDKVAQGIDHAQQALALSQKLEYEVGIADSFQHLGILHARLDRFEQAMDALRKAGEIYLRMNDRRSLASIHLVEGGVCFDQGQFQLALEHFDQGLEISRQLGDREQVVDFYRVKADLHSKQGDYENALKFYKLMTSTKEEILNRDTNARIAEIRIKYEADRKEKENILLAKDNELLHKNSEIQQLQLSKEKLKIRAFIVGFALTALLILVLIKKYLYLFSFWKKKNHIGHYRLVDTLGTGGMGIVYKAFHIMNKSSSVAIKVIREEYAQDPVQRRRFLHEAILIDQLDHPHIIKVFERGEYEGRLYMAMELIEGQSLAAFLEREQHVPLDQCLTIMLQLSETIRAIHAKGVLHRDLKPDNIMLVTHQDNEQYVKLLDFGLARNQSLTHLTETGEIIGTLFYLPPEQFSRRSFDQRSDIYALGVIFYELITLERPFWAEQPLELIRQILEQTPLEPVSLRADLEVDLNGLIMSMISKEPDKRPSIEAILDTLIVLSDRHRFDKQVQPLKE